MATQADAYKAIIDTIHVMTTRGPLNESQARAVLDLAEAWAWLVQPDQPHGGNVAKA